MATTASSSSGSQERELMRCPLFSIHKTTKSNLLILRRGYMKECLESVEITYTLTEDDIFVSMRPLIAYFVGDDPESEDMIDRIVHRYLTFLGFYPQKSIEVVMVSVGGLASNLVPLLDKYYPSYVHIVAEHRSFGLFQFLERLTHCMEIGCFFGADGQPCIPIDMVLA